MAVDTSYLTTQVNNIVDQLHGIFDQIGVPAHERESRESEVCTSNTHYHSEEFQLLMDKVV